MMLRIENPDICVRKHRKKTKETAYEVIFLYHLHMPSYIEGAFTEYP